MGYDTGPGGDHCVHGFRSTASTLLTKRALRLRFSGSPTRPRRGEKRRRRRDEVVRCQLGEATRTRSATSITVRRLLGRTRAFNAALVRASTAYATVRPPSRCADRRPSLLSFRPSAAKRDIHPRCRGRSWSCLPFCRLCVPKT
jgi:hypothetical protein